MLFRLKCFGGNYLLGDCIYPFGNFILWMKPHQSCHGASSSILHVTWRHTLRHTSVPAYSTRAGVISVGGKGKSAVFQQISTIDEVDFKPHLSLKQLLPTNRRNKLKFHGPEIIVKTHTYIHVLEYTGQKFALVQSEDIKRSWLNQEYNYLNWNTILHFISFLIYLGLIINAA